MANSNAANALLRLSGDLTVRTIVSARRKISAQLQKTPSIRIDMHEASNTDLTLVQLIESARRSAETADKQIELVQPLPAALAELLDRGGFLSTDAARRFWLGENRP